MKLSKKYVNQALEDLNFRDMMPIQEAVIPEALKGRDIIGCSQTGSGKTHAFMIPVFEHLQEDTHEIQTVIVSPTRELASQLYEVARHIASFYEGSIDIRLYTGGQDRSREIERLKKSQPQIVIGTPGKIYDLAIKENVLKTYKAKKLIIDEADMALEIGFLTEIDEIARTMNDALQMMVFSATVPETLQPFLRKYMTQPKAVMLDDLSLSALNIDHKFIRYSSDEDREFKWQKMLKGLNPYLALIFANKKEDVEKIYQSMFQAGYNVTTIHGDMPPRKRKQVLKEINRLRYQYVVASDMASRGLDIDGISHVINYDLPKDMAFFIHRIGRTGRAGHHGETISFYSQKDTHALEFMEKHKMDVDIKELKPRQKRQPKPEPMGPRKKLKVKPNYKKKLKQKKKR